MNQKFTDDDILRFLYDEMEQAESERFLDALCSDEDLWERYEYFQEVVEKISGLSYEPSDYSCQQVMAYVALTKPQEEEPSQKGVYLSGLRAPRMNTNAILMLVLALFGSITIIGSIYQMQQAQQENQHSQATPTQEQRFQWEDPELNSKMDDLKHEIEQMKNFQ